MLIDIEHVELDIKGLREMRDDRSFQKDRIVLGSILIQFNSGAESFYKRIIVSCFKNHTLHMFL